MLLRYLCIIFCLLLWACQTPKQPERPNVLWITIEDLTPMLGCYGDPVAVTPTIDGLAARGVRYTNAYASAAVCSPARSCLITGVFATTLGTQNLRSETEIPEEIIPFPKYLREAGYYCTNNYKEDYNFEIADIWDESSKTAHWKNRAPGQPFFAVFNFETTHQSKIFGTDTVYRQRHDELLSQIERTNPEEIILPSYSFDTPEIRKLWARYYDNVRMVDLQIRELLNELAQHDLLDQTIIFFYSDHGTGMPRGKRALYDSGTRVPLIIAAPEAYQDRYQLHPGLVDQRLISFVDFAPTLLEMLEVEVPNFMQGYNFLTSENEFAFATSDRVDEAYELVRSVRTQEYRYIRNYLPHRPLIQPNYYSDQSEISKENQRMLETNPEMNAAQQSMWQPKRPVEELYHTKTDPDETNNLATNPQYQQVLDELRGKNKEMILRTRDSGLATEAYMYSVSEGSTPYHTLKDPNLFPLDSILQLSDELYFNRSGNEKILDYLHHQHPLIQYWTMIGLQYRPELDQDYVGRLKTLSQGPLSLVSITAAETLCKFGYLESINKILEGLRTDNPYLLLMSARAFELTPNKPTEAMLQAQQIWEKLKTQTKDKRKGYDLYAYWSLCQVFDP